METHNFCPRAEPPLPITKDGKVDVTEYNFPSREQVDAARKAVAAAKAN